jgi:hypothetical protein
VSCDDSDCALAVLRTSSHVALIINNHIHKPANATSVIHEIIASMVIVLLINVRRRCFLAAKRSAITHHTVAIYML